MLSEALMRLPACGGKTRELFFFWAVCGRRLTLWSRWLGRLAAARVPLASGHGESDGLLSVRAMFDVSA